MSLSSSQYSAGHLDLGELSSYQHLLNLQFSVSREMLLAHMEEGV